MTNILVATFFSCSAINLKAQWHANYGYLGMDILQTFPQKWMTWACHNHYGEFYSSLILREFYDKVGGDVGNVVFIYMHFIMKCVNIWKMSITQGTDILQMPNAGCYKIMHG